MNGLRWCTVALSMALASILGCNGSSPSSSSSSPADGKQQGEPGHDHHHDHAHDHSHEGPHGGHILGLGEEQYHAEWTHDDESGKITVFILDAEARQEVPITAESIAIDAHITDKDPQTYHLKAVAPSGDPPKTARFETVDQGLLTTLLVVGEGAAATMTVTVDGQDYAGKFEHHEHDHGHGHGH